MGAFVTGRDRGGGVKICHFGRDVTIEWPLMHVLITWTIIQNYTGNGNPSLQAIAILSRFIRAMAPPKYASDAQSHGSVVLSL